MWLQTSGRASARSRLEVLDAAMRALNRVMCVSTFWRCWRWFTRRLARSRLRSIHSARRWIWPNQAASCATLSTWARPWPACWRGCAAGRRLGGLTISQAVPATKTDAAIVELTGCLADQAALNGVLNTLYDYHYPVLRVEYLGPADEL